MSSYLLDTTLGNVRIGFYTHLTCVKRLAAVRLDIVTPPEVAHRRFTHPLIGRHEPATPMSYAFRLRLQRGVDHRLDLFGTVGGLATPAWRNLPKARRSLRDKTFAPETNRFPIDIQLGGDGSLTLTLAGRENNSAAERHLLRRSQRRQPLLDLFALILRHDQRACWAGHD